ncbi:hypothetical protein ABKN59_009086 [Abortiporus biennis]
MTHKISLSQTTAQSAVVIEDNINLHVVCFNPSFPFDRCFFINIPLNVFHGYVQHSYCHFATQIPYELDIEVHARSIAVWKPKQDISVNDIMPGWTEGINGINGVKEMATCLAAVRRLETLVM